MRFCFETNRSFFPRFFQQHGKLSYVLSSTFGAPVPHHVSSSSCAEHSLSSHRSFACQCGARPDVDSHPGLQDVSSGPGMITWQHDARQSCMLACNCVLPTVDVCMYCCIAQKIEGSCQFPLLVQLVLWESRQ